jgi:hypothetical protein
MHLKNPLRQIKTNRRHLRHHRFTMWIKDDPSSHINGVGGRFHHQNHLAGEIDGRRLIGDPLGFCMTAEKVSDYIGALVLLDELCCSPTGV